MSARGWLLRIAVVGSLVAASAACILGPKQDDPTPGGSDNGAGGGDDSGGAFAVDSGSARPDAPAVPGDSGVGGLDGASADTGRRADGAVDAAADIGADAETDGADGDAAPSDAPDGDDAPTDAPTDASAD